MPRSPLSSKMVTFFCEVHHSRAKRSKSLEMTFQRPPKKWFWASEAKNNRNCTVSSTKICQFLTPDFFNNVMALQTSSQTSLPDLLRGRHFQLKSGHFASTPCQFPKFTNVFYSTFVMPCSPLSSKMATFVCEVHHSRAKSLKITLNDLPETPQKVVLGLRSQKLSKSYTFKY